MCAMSLQAEFGGVVEDFPGDEELARTLQMQFDNGQPVQFPLKKILTIGQ
jgi:hypothetical protein